MSKKVFIVGATGSIGDQTLDVLRTLNAQGFEYRVVGISLNSRWERAVPIIEEFSPRFCCVADNNVSVPQKYNSTVIRRGFESINSSIEELCPDITVVGSSGFKSLSNTLCAIRNSERVCLANKESIVCGGNMIFNAAQRYSTQIIPVDSEHSAIFQLLQGEKSAIQELIITASGGSLRDLPLENFTSITPEKVLSHPVWKMGARITVDSASMINKGLEVMEAFYLFKTSSIKVLINRKSMVHSAVRFTDGVYKIHYGRADMRIPIAYSITYPQRSRLDYEGPDLYSEPLLFENVDYQRYPSLKLAFDILGNQLLHIAYNASDEAAVEMFLNKRISFPDIYKLVCAVISSVNESKTELNDLEEISFYDELFRRKTYEIIGGDR